MSLKHAEHFILVLVVMLLGELGPKPKPSSRLHSITRPTTQSAIWSQTTATSTGVKSRSASPISTQARPTKTGSCSM